MKFLEFPMPPKSVIFHGILFMFLSFLTVIILNIFGFDFGQMSGEAITILGATFFFGSIVLLKVYELNIWAGIVVSIITIILFLIL